MARSTFFLDRGLDEAAPTAEEREAIAVAALKSGNIATNPREPTLDDVRAVVSAVREPLCDTSPAERPRRYHAAEGRGADVAALALGYGPTVAGPELADPEPGSRSESGARNGADRVLSGPTFPVFRTNAFAHAGFRTSVSSGFMTGQVVTAGGSRFS